MLLFYFISLASIISHASAICNCSPFSKPKLTTLHAFSVLYHPRDNVTSLPCNPGRCIYTIEAKGNKGVGGNIYYVRNFLNSKATLKFYDGNDIATEPYFELDGNTENSELTKTIPSHSQFVTIVLEISPDITQNVPTFIFYATSTKHRTTSLRIKTTTAKTPFILPELTTLTSTEAATTTITATQAQSTALTTYAHSTALTTTTPSTTAKAETTTTTTTKVPATSTTTQVITTSTTSTQDTNFISIDVTKTGPKLTTTIQTSPSTFNKQHFSSSLKTPQSTHYLSENIFIEKIYIFDGDIALILDINSKNFAKLIEIAINVVNSLTISPFIQSESARVNIILYNHKVALPYGWNLNKHTLQLVLKNMVPTMENVGNGYYINSLGHFLNTIFEESKIVRQNTQRLAIIVTDNEDIIIGEAEKDEFRSDHNLNLADIHPVFVNFNKNKTASEIYLLSGIKFSGTDSNLIVFHNYINNEELFVKVLLDGNVLCAKNESMPETTKNSAIFPIIYGNNKKGRRYCNNMKITTFCKIIDINVPIVVTINNMDIQPQKDLISIFDDNSNLRSVISGHQISGLNVTIPDSKFVKVVFTTGPTKVYYGGQITFDNCIVDS